MQVTNNTKITNNLQDYFTADKAVNDILVRIFQECTFDELNTLIYCCKRFSALIQSNPTLLNYRLKILEAGVGLNTLIREKKYTQAAQHITLHFPANEINSICLKKFINVSENNPLVSERDSLFKSILHTLPPETIINLANEFFKKTGNRYDYWSKISLEKLETISFEKFLIAFDKAELGPVSKYDLFRQRLMCVDFAENYKRGAELLFNYLIDIKNNRNQHWSINGDRVTEFLCFLGNKALVKSDIGLAKKIAIAISSDVLNCPFTKKEKLLEGLVKSMPANKPDESIIDIVLNSKITNDNAADSKTKNRLLSFIQ